MSDEGEQRGPSTSESEDWWGQLYDAEATDAGRTRARDTLDDRFASIIRAVSSVPELHQIPEGSDTGRPEERELREAREAELREMPEAAPGTGGAEPLPGPGDEPTPAPEAEPGPAPRPPREKRPAPLDEPALLDGPEPGPGAHPPVPGAVPEPRAGATPAVEPSPEPEPDPASAPASALLADPAPEAEPGALPVADPAALGELVPDTALDGAHYGVLTLRAVSMRGEVARQAGMLRGDALLTARFGAGENALLLVAVAAGSRTGPGAHRAAREVCHSIGGAVGRSHARLAEDILAGRREALKSGLHRLTDRTLGKLRSQAAALGLDPEQHTADLRCLLLPADPRCRTRVFFGTAEGGLFRLRDGVWQDIEPRVSGSQPVGGPVMGYGGEPGPRPTAATAPSAPSTPSGKLSPPEDPTARAAAERDGFTEEPRDESARARPFRFRASAARPGDALMVCSAGVAEPMREGTGFAEALAERWAPPAEPPGLAAYLTALQRPLKGHEADRTAATVWEA